MGFVLGASITGEGDPSHRFFNGGGELAGEEVSSQEGLASVVGMASVVGREFGAAERNGAALERIEKEFWVAIPEEATGAVNDTFLCFIGIFEHQN